MRTFVISLAAIGTALALATPATAQYYPQPQNYGYGAPQQYGYGQQYGYNNGDGQVRALQARIDAVQYQINRLDRRGGSNGLRKEARNIERQLQRSGRYGLNPYLVNELNSRIARLEQRVRYASANRWGRGNGDNGANRYNGSYGYNGGYGYNGSYGYNGGYNRGDNGDFADRDRDGRDDRYEDDQGRDHDD